MLESMTPQSLLKVDILANFLLPNHPTSESLIFDDGATGSIVIPRAIVCGGVSLNGYEGVVVVHILDKMESIIRECGGKSTTWTGESEPIIVQIVYGRIERVYRIKVVFTGLKKRRLTDNMTRFEIR
jgi:hypothetical protein